MNQVLLHLRDAMERLPDDGGFLAGRLALVIFIIGLIVVAAVIAFVIPGS
jgi:hypothetical protein